MCENLDDPDALNLCSWANLKLFRNQEEENLDYLINSIKGFANASLKSNKISVSLLFTHFSHHYDINTISNEIDKIPLHFFIDCTPLIISYILKLNENDQSFNDFIYN